MHFSGLILATLATVAAAAPTSNVFNDVYNFDSNLEEFYSRVSAHIGRYANGPPSSCDVSKVSLPSSNLPAPTGTLKYVAVGRGTQVCRNSFHLIQTCILTFIELHLRRLYRRRSPHPNRRRRKPLRRLLRRRQLP